MNMSDKLAHKIDVYNICVKLLIDRIDVCKLTIAAAQQASNEEEKSSAGDKFETSRAMNHLEKEMYSKQLQLNLNELAALESIKADIIYDAVRPGAYMVCKDFDVFIAAGLGKFMHNDRPVYLLSPEAPLAATLRNKRAGDGFIFNKQEEKILEVY